MAKIVMGILGGFSGRVGTVVGYHRRGQWFVRAYQPCIKDRKSAAQLVQRSRFKAMIQFAAQATGVLRVGLREKARVQGITEGNCFLRENHACFAVDAGSPRVDFAGLRFSKGSLPGVCLVEADAEEGGVLRVRWASLGGVRGDKVHIYIYDAVSCRGLAAEGTRGEGRVDVLLPEGFGSGELHVWAFAEGACGRVSPTAYSAVCCGGARGGEEKKNQPSCNICAPRALLKLNYNNTHVPHASTRSTAVGGLSG